MAAEDLTSVYARLRSFLKAEDFEQALPVCEELPADDPDVCKAKVVCLVQLGDYEGALDTADRAPVGCDASFERAYCLYQLNRLDDKALAAPVKMHA